MIKIAPREVLFLLLYLQVDSCKESAWGGGTVDESCIAIHALIKVGLELVKDILYTCVNLQRIVFVERNIVAKFDVPLEERRRGNFFIFWYISCKVLHQHIACYLAVGDNVEMFYRLDIAEEIAIVVWGTEHAALWCNVWILAPLQWFDIAAMVVGITRLESKQVTKAHLGFDIHTRHACAARVGTC